MPKSRPISSDYQKGREASRKMAAEHVENRQREARERRIERLFGYAGLPSRFRGKTLNSLELYDHAIERAVHVCNRYAANFDQVRENGTCLSLVGIPGTGKTHAASAILEAVVGRGYVGLFVTMSDILRAFRASYSGQGYTEDQVLDYFTEPDLLVVDEVGFALGNIEKTRAILFDVFDRRYREHKPVLILGNLTPAELGRYLGERIYRRIQENGGTVLAFDWMPYAEHRA